MENDLLKSVEEFQRRTGLSDHRVGMILARNGRLLPRLRSGGRVWPEKAAEIRSALKRETKNRPQAAE